MALLRINGQLEEFSNDNNMLTLTNDEYEEYPGAERYAICVTEDKMITRFGNFPKLNDLLVNVCLRDNSIDISARNTVGIISAEDGAYTLPRYVDASNKARMSEHHIIWDPETQSHTHLHDDYPLDAQVLNEFVTHLYAEQIFIASVYRDHNGGLISTLKKIVRCWEFQNHYLVKYEDDPDTYLLLRCYACHYEVKFDHILPGSMTKSARVWAESQVS